MFPREFSTTISEEENSSLFNTLRERKSNIPSVMTSLAKPLMKEEIVLGEVEHLKNLFLSSYPPASFRRSNGKIDFLVQTKPYLLAKAVSYLQWNFS